MGRQLLSRRLVLASAVCSVPFAVHAQSFSPDQLGSLLDRIPAGTGRGARLSQNQIGLGLKEALKVASRRIVGRLGKTDGYYGDPLIRIPLPEPLQKIERPLRALGAGGVVDDLRLKMNRAAEQAAPKAFDIFVDAATKMTFDDARMILAGPQDAATQYFKRTTSRSLAMLFRPIVDSALSAVGAVAAFSVVQSRARGLPLVGQSVADFSLTDFTVTKALDGLFRYLAIEEAEIRSNPVARTTNLLRQVFG